MSKDTLIIGGNGYIGSELYKKIEADSVDLCSFGSDLGYSIKQNYNSFDISSYKNIVLLAAHSSVQMCEYNKTNAWINNVEYFYSLCEKLCKNQKLIYASSGSVYGQKKGISSESDINLSAINHYDLTKITNDIIVNKFINDGKQIIGLRFGTVNGYSENIRSDLMINSMVYAAKTLGYIKINNDWIKRPILGVEDLTNAIIAILNNKEFYSGQYNLCSFNSSVKSIAERVSQKLNCEIVKTPDSDKCYDFEISSAKFEQVYSFKFKQTIDTIIDGLLEADISKYSRRDTDDRLFNSNI